MYKVYVDYGNVFFFLFLYVTTFLLREETVVEKDEKTKT